jgi:hypothetical protein
MILNDTLSIVVENSFDGAWSEKDGVYLSRKRSGGEGTGLSSVRAICAGYEGMVKIDISSNTWKSSALVDLTGHLGES